MKIAIVNKRTKKVESFYIAEAPNQSSFGGNWADASAFEHVEIPSDLQDAAMDELEAFDTEVQIDTVTVQVGEEPAYTADKKPVKGLLGQAIMVPVYEEQPVMKPVRLMRRKS